MLRLPHPELVEFVNALKPRVIGPRRAKVVGTVVNYLVYRGDQGMTELGACYDVDGTIYLDEGLVQHAPEYADLIVFHEHIEIQHKRAGRSHAYAHRRALLMELLAAKEVLPTPTAWERYVGWRVASYQDWKVPDRAALVSRFTRLLAADRPRRYEYTPTETGLLDFIVLLGQN